MSTAELCISSFGILPSALCLLVLVKIGVSPRKTAGSRKRTDKRKEWVILLGIFGEMTPKLPGSDPELQAEGENCRSWPQMQAEVLERDHYRCRICGAKGDRHTLHVYPIRPGVLRARSLLTLCSSCQAPIEKVRRSENVSLVFLVYTQMGQTFVTSTAAARTCEFSQAQMVTAAESFQPACLER